MKLRSIMTVSLLAVILLVSCAPTAAPAPVEPEAPAQPAPLENEPPAPPVATPTVVQPEPTPAEALPTEAPTEAPQAVATSRGPDLEASDPTTANLVSGDLQLVEFFRFT